MLDQMNVELRRDVTGGKAIENAVAALGAAFADDHFRQRRVGLLAKIVIVVPENAAAQRRSP
jgi:hypothetical protein